jgi:membrane protease YdiL (CAAX protease family)
MMAIVPAQAPGNPFTVLWPALFLGVGAATAAATGVFRRNSIAGPQRLQSARSLEPLTVITGLGMATYFLVVMVVLRVLEGPQPPTTNPALSSADIAADLLARAAAVTAILAMILILHRRPWLGLSPRQFLPGVAKGLLGLLMVLPLMFLVLMAANSLINPQEQHIHPYLKMLGQSQGDNERAMILFSIVAVAPISEEIFFRGCVQTLLSALFGRGGRPAMRWAAVVVTSLIFAMAHGDWWERPPIFVLSLCLGYAYERTGNLWTAITIHAAFNAAQAAIFFEFVGSR